MKRKQSSDNKKTNKKKKGMEKNKDETSSEKQEISQAEETWEVESIYDFKKTKEKGSGGYKLFVKWVGYDEKENTWESMKPFLDQWTVPRKDIYTFLTKFNIDVSRIEGRFDLITGKELKK